MKRLLLYALIAIGAVNAVPALRDRAEGPAAAVASELRPLVDDLVDPVRSQWALREQRVIMEQLSKQRLSGRRIPRAWEFSYWLDENTLSGRIGVDPWGGSYYLNDNMDGSVTVGAPGPDRLRSTSDDIVLRSEW